MAQSRDCRVIYFALAASVRVLLHMQRATSAATHSEALAAVLGECEALRTHLLALLTRADDALFGNADERQRRGLRVAALHALMQLMRGQAELAADRSRSRRPKHLLDVAALRDVLAALCDVPAAARKMTRVKLSLNALASAARGDQYPDDDADSDVDEAVAMKQRSAIRRADDELLSLIDEFCADYGAKFDDVRYHTMRLLARSCELVRRATAVGHCSRKASARFCRLAHALLVGVASVAPADATQADAPAGDDAKTAATPDASLDFFVPVVRRVDEQTANKKKAKKNGGGGDDDDDSLSAENVADALHDDDIDDATFARLLEDSDSDDVEDAAQLDGVQSDSKRKRKGAKQVIDGAAGILRIELRREHRKAFGDCWLAFLRLPLPLHVFKASLGRLTDHILPHMEQPLLLCDLLSNAFSRGGATALLALSGLFQLIVRHNLDYPHFFEQLYSLLEPNIFLVKYRARFFELTSLFLSSPMLPASTAAAFVRRTLQLAACGPAYAGLLAIPFAYNIVRRHPACVPMIHREQRALVFTQQAAANSASLFAAAATKQQTLLLNSKAAAADDVQEGKAKWVDPFDADEPLPDMARAIDSSIFELEALRRSYYQVTGKLVQIFEQPIGNSDQPLTSVLTTEYNELMNHELQRMLRSAAPTAIKSDLTALTAKDRLFVDVALSDEEWIRTLQGEAVDGDDDDEDDDADDDDNVVSAAKRPMVAAAYANPDDEVY